MPAYSYTCDTCKRTLEDFRTQAAGPRRTVRCECGAQARRDYQAEQSGRQVAYCGEIESKLAVGCLPQNARAKNREMAERGLGDAVRFDERTGNAIFNGRQGRLRALKAMGFHDKDEIRG